MSNEEPRYTEDELQSRLEEAVQKAITVNVNQVLSAPETPLEDMEYPGMGAGSHILHLLLTLITSGLWLPVWITLAIVNRSKWDKKMRNLYKQRAERQVQREGEQNG